MRQFAIICAVLASTASRAGAETYAVGANGVRVRTAYDFDARFFVGLLAGASNASATGDFGASGTKLELRTKWGHLTSSKLWRNQWEFLSGEINLGDAPLRKITASLASASFVRHSDKPGLVIGSTFVPIPLYVGFDVEALRLETNAKDSGNFADLSFLGTNVYVELVHSRDMRSFLRVLGGGQLGLNYARAETGGGSIFAGPQAGLAARIAGRLQAATLTALWSWRFVGGTGWRNVARAAAEYEVVALAVAEQPISLVARIAYCFDDRFDARLPRHRIELLGGARFNLGAK